MRTTEQTFDLPLDRKHSTSRLAMLTNVVASAWRAIRNRNAIGNLRDLDDHQLLDMGLQREDVHAALTSSFFDDAGRHLTQSARKRTNAYYSDIRCR